MSAPAGELTTLEAKAVYSVHIVRGRDPRDGAPVDVQKLSVGYVVTIHSRGCWRWAIVEAIGPRRISVVYTTPGALQDATRYGGPPQLTRKAIAHELVFEARP